MLLKHKHLYIGLTVLTVRRFIHDQTAERKNTINAKHKPLIHKKFDWWTKRSL